MINKILSALLCIAIIFASQTGLAQAPEGVNYQAVARNASGDVMTNQTLEVRMTIKESGPTGTTVYQETHNTTTNDFGLFNLVVGEGSTITGNFSNIDWGNSTHYLQVEVDPGSGYVNLGTSQFVSVPYALYAKEAGNAGTSYNAGTGIDISGNTITNTGDTDPTNDLTITSTAGGDVSGTFSNLTVEGIQGRPVSATAPGSGQVLKWNGSEWAPANDVGGGSGDDWGSQVVQSDATLSGDGTAGNNLGIAQQGATSGEVLKWNGSSWVPDTDNTGGGGSDSDWSIGSGIIYNMNDNVGIGTNSPAYPLEIDGGSGTALSVYSTSTTSDKTVEITNTAGTAMSVGAGQSISGYPTIPTGITVQAATGHQALFVSTQNERGIVARSDDGGTAIEGYVFSGNGRSAYFHGGSGVEIRSGAEVHDGLQTDELQVTTGANAGFLLQSDASGNASWVDPGTLGISPWETSGSTVYYNNGNIGIGTNNPDELLHVSSSSGTYIKSQATSGPAYFEADGSGNAGLKMRENGTVQAYVYWNPSEQGLAFYESSSISMMLKNDQLGVGTTSPDNELTVNGTADVTGNLGIGTSSPTHKLEVTQDMSGSNNVLVNLQPTNIGSGNDVIEIEAGTSAPDDFSFVEFQRGDIEFQVLGNGTVNMGLINGPRDLNIKQNTQNSSQAGIYLERSDNTDNWSMYHATTQNLWFKYNDGLTSWIEPSGTYTVSDRSLKEDIQSMGNVMDRIVKLKPSTYTYKKNDKQTVGFIAQEVKDQFPEVVDYEQEAEFYGINYGAMSAIAIKAIQEQQKEIEKLERENNDLQQQINNLRQRVQNLEN